MAAAGRRHLSSVSRARSRARETVESPCGSSGAVASERCTWGRARGAARGTTWPIEPVRVSRIAGSGVWLEPLTVAEASIGRP